MFKKKCLNIKNKPQRFLFIKNIDQDPFQHSFMNGVLVEELGNRNVPVFIIQQKSIKKKLEITKKTIATLYTINYYQSKNVATAFIFSFFNVLFFYYEILKLIFTKEVTHVIIRNEWYSLLLMSLLRIFIEIPLIYQEAFPMEEYGLTQCDSNSFRGKVRKFYLKFRLFTKYRLIGKCDLVLVMSKTMQDFFVIKKIRPNKILITPMGVSAKLDYSIQPNSDASKKFEGKFIVFYNGTLARIREPEKMIDAFEIVKKKYDNLTFLIIAGGVKGEVGELEKLRPAIKDSKHYIIIENIDRDMVLNYLRFVDVGISVIPPLDLFKVGSVTKVTEMLLFSVPVIANVEIPEQEAMSKECEAVLPCTYKVESIAKTLENAIKDRNNLKNKGEIGNKYILQNRTYEKITEELLSSINGINLPQ